ncbi:MAG TPA: hypothetical protein VMG58_13845 [Candidatus Sulfotelmatobacter sp.]|nr:hypothetical protein [Candidatus Sulfotelmatobacter sp.]
MQRVADSEDHQKRMAEVGLTIKYLDADQYGESWEEYEAKAIELIKLAKE